jgi:hypothetical protein
MAKKKRIVLALQIHNTQKLLMMFLTLGCVFLGTMYVFLFNKVAMRGYVLQQETDQHNQLLIDKEKIYSRISQYETRDFISEAPVSQAMMVNINKNFAVIKSQALTAKK